MQVNKIKEIKQWLAQYKEQNIHTYKTAGSATDTNITHKINQKPECFVASKIPVLLLLLPELFSFTLSIQQEIMLFDRTAISVHYQQQRSAPQFICCTKLKSELAGCGNVNKDTTATSHKARPHKAMPRVHSAYLESVRQCRVHGGGVSEALLDGVA